MLSEIDAVERELDTLLVEYAILSEVRPRAPGAVYRANIGRLVDATLKRIHEIEMAIVNTQACTLAEAAVQLRRLVASVLGVVEGAAKGCR